MASVDVVVVNTHEKFVFKLTCEPFLIIFKAGIEMLQPRVV